MIGRIILRESLKNEAVCMVISLVRRPSGISHSKLKEQVHPDFTRLESARKAFEGIDVAYFCVGAYTGAVSDEEFKKITVDQAVAFGDALMTESPGAHLTFLSGAGADRTEKSRVSFARYKGMAENHLLSLSLGGLSVFRPGYIYPVKKRSEPNFSYRLMRWLYPVLKYIMPHVTSEQLAMAMFVSGITDTPDATYENKMIPQFLKDHSTQKATTYIKSTS